MKSILLSIKPKWVEKILNGEKTIEIRKRFPRDYVGWVYIYVTKDSKKGWCMVGINGNETYYQKYDKNAIYSTAHNYIGNGKVVARFWCDTVEEIKNNLAMRFFTESANEKELLEKSCLNSDQLFWYLAPQELKVKCCGHAIHITKLEIFNKPKELSEFGSLKIKRVFKDTELSWLEKGQKFTFGTIKPLTKAPQNYCYIESEASK